MGAAKNGSWESKVRRDQVESDETWFRDLAEERRKWISRGEIKEVMIVDGLATGGGQRRIHDLWTLLVKP